MTLTELIRKMLDSEDFRTSGLFRKMVISTITISGQTNSRNNDDGKSGPWTIKVLHRSRLFRAIHEGEYALMKNTSQIRNEEVVHTLFIDGTDPVVEIEKQIIELRTSGLLCPLSVSRTESDAGLSVEWVIKIEAEFSFLLTRKSSRGGIDPMPGQMSDAPLWADFRIRRRHFLQ